MIRRSVIVLLAALAVSAGLALPAGAHVTVGSDNATKGGWATITIRVPNEEAAADTVGLKVQLPADHPIANVSVQPKPGWTYEVTRTTLDTPIETGHGSVSEVVSEITWTGGAIAPGEFDQFLIQAGPLPTDTDALTFKAIQTYADDAGATTEVAWIEEAEPGEDSPPRPAPVLHLTDADADDGHHAAAGDGADGSASSATTDGTDAEVTAAVAADTDDTLATIAIVTAVIGLSAGVAGIVLAMNHRCAARTDRTFR